MPEPEDSKEQMRRAEFEKNRAQIADRFPKFGDWTAPISRVRVEKAIAEASQQGVILDYSPDSAAGLNRLIESWEHLAIVAFDLKDGAWVGEDVARMVDIPALGTYFGEFFRSARRSQVDSSRR